MIWFIIFVAVISFCTGALIVLMHRAPVDEYIDTDDIDWSNYGVFTEYPETPICFRKPYCPPCKK